MTESKEINYMLVQDGCGACAEAKELFKKDITDKNLVLVDITSEKGMEMVEKHDVDSVPTIINEKDSFQQKCFISKEGERMFWEDGTEKQLLKKSD